MDLRRRRVAIVGAGFSGSAVAIHLSLAPIGRYDICLIDPSEPGPGLAHSTRHPQHRLNGPDSIHVLYPERPGHFSDWVRSSGALDADPKALASNGLVYPRRSVFGAYMSLELARHAGSNDQSGSTIQHLRDRVSRLSKASLGWDVELESGGRFPAELCILATGWNDLQVPPQLRPIANHPGWIGNPWDLEKLASIPSTTPVLLVGNGLTASDVFATLDAQGHAAPVFALSRRGVRPASQPRSPSAVSFMERFGNPKPPFVQRHPDLPSTRAILRALRADIEAAEVAGIGWHQPFDEMRDAVRVFWPNLAPIEQRRFIRHLKPWYDANRYRNPPQIEKIIADGVARGQLTFLAGRLCNAVASASASASANRLAIQIAVRKGNRETLEVGAAVNCTGPQPRPSLSSNRLVRDLVERHAISDSPTGIGMHVDAAFRAIDVHGNADPNLRVIGPPTIGSLGESAAVPFITSHVCELVRTLDSEFASQAN